MIASCGVLGLDWREVGAGEFAEAIEAHNAASTPGGTQQPASVEFKAFMHGQFRQS